MAVAVATRPSLYEALMEEDYPLPANCRDVEIKMPVDGLFEIVYHCFLSPEDMETIGKVFQRIAEKRKTR